MKRYVTDTSTPVARINVVPIIDVALVLVIILMVTAPMIAVSSLDVELPRAKTRSMEGVDRVHVTFGTTGALAVDEKDVTAQEFSAALAASMAEHDDDILVVVRADARVSYEAVEALVKEIRSAGAKRVAIGTTQHGGTKSDE
ncbi:MAG TPA: biopolymer transporter ExbD [Candidatus Krumholzibacteria bacterium]|nr:biopolymer transporter ExbD [Candidatus Krumholzibacteria bacterium]